jgi:hypothetical protein
MFLHMNTRMFQAHVAKPSMSAYMTAEAQIHFITIIDV